jgi:hypothetical protein
MGISIYYDLKLECPADRARQVVRALHAFAQTQAGFASVSPVLEFDPPDGQYAFDRADDDPDLAAWKPGTLYLTREQANGADDHVCVPPRHVICFSGNRDGSEPAVFGLATHPAVVRHRETVTETGPDGIPTDYIGRGRAVEFPTGLGGWYSWWFAVKTQYAGDPRAGGEPNFLRAHKAVFAVVDFAKTLGLTTDVRDDTTYWKDRDDARLLAELRRWNELMAGFAGQLTDAMGPDRARLVAPIKDRPDYEHLEARGAEELNKIQATWAENADRDRDKGHDEN